MTGLALALGSTLALPLQAQQVTTQSGQLAPASLGQQAAGDPIRKADTVLVTGEQPGPEMWLVRSPDGLREMYVMATLSPLPAGMRLQSRRIDAIIDNAQEVIREPYVSMSVDTGWFKGLLLLPKLLGARKNPDGRKLQDVVSPASYGRWTALKARYIGTDGGVESWRPLFAAQELYQAAIKKSGLGSKGVVSDVVNAAIEKHHPNVTVVKHQMVVKDPKPLLKEWSKTTLDDVACFDKTMTLIDTELGSMRLRANAWATGDMSELKRLPAPYQWEACTAAISEAGIGKRLGFGDASLQLREKWLAAAEKALANNTVTFAMLQINEVLKPDGYLAALKAKGYTVLAPDE